MSTTTKRPLCGECEDGFIVDPTTLLPVRRCECRLGPTAAAGRDAGLKAAREAHPSAFDAALAIITDTAQVLPEFSANETRDAMKIAQIPGPVIAAAFARAISDEVIAECGRVRSTDPGTHRHWIANYKSAARAGRRTA